MVLRADPLDSRIGASTPLESGAILGIGWVWGLRTGDGQGRGMVGQSGECVEQKVKTFGGDDRPAKQESNGARCAGRSRRDRLRQRNRLHMHSTDAHPHHPIGKVDRRGEPYMGRSEGIRGSFDASADHRAIAGWGPAGEPSDHAKIGGQAGAARGGGRSGADGAITVHELSSRARNGVVMKGDDHTCSPVAGDHREVERPARQVVHMHHIRLEQVEHPPNGTRTSIPASAKAARSGNVGGVEGDTAPCTRTVAGRVSDEDLASVLLEGDRLHTGHDTGAAHGVWRTSMKDLEHSERAHGQPPAAANTSSTWAA